MEGLKSWAALAVALAGTVMNAYPCLHPPRDYPGKLGSALQEYLFYREGEDVHMIMNQKIRSDSEMPKDLAWVTPLPAVPSAYHQENAELFERFFRATEPVMRSAPKGGSLRLMRIHDTVRVGDYEIIPIEIADTLAGGDLNAWLARNGYAEVPYQGLRYYLKPKACFLAIKVRGLKGRENRLHPLHVVYRSSEARVPLKFFANAGSFDAYVYLKGRPGKVKAQVGLAAAGFSRTGSARADSSLAGNLGLKGFAVDSAAVERHFAPRLNGRKQRLAEWKEDPLLDLD